MFKMWLTETAKMAALVLGILAALAAGAANAITFNYLDSKPSCVTLTVSSTGAITCNTGTSSIPYNFASALSCPAGLAISATTGAVSCAKTLPVCALSATPATVAPGESVSLTASCSNTPTSYQWTPAAGLTAGSGNTATVTLPLTATPGVYAYSVTASNAGGAGGVASALVKVGDANQKGPFAYIAHQASSAKAGSISVLDTSTGSVVATIPVGVYPLGVAVNEAGTRVYVTNQGSNTVSVIDTANNSVVASVPVGVSPSGVAVNPAGTRVYVANSGGKSVSVIDTATNTVIATLKVGDTPAGVAVNQAGTRVYVTNQGDNTVSVIDVTASPNSVTSVGVASKPYGLAVAGAQVYVANGDTSSVSVIDTAVSPYAVSTVKVGLNPRGVDVSPDGKTVYVANSGDRTVSVIDVATRTVTATVTVGVLPAFVAFNPTGTLAFVTNQGDNTVSTIDVAANAAIPSAVVPVGTGGLYAFGKFIAPSGTQNYLGLWWNPNESGWGMSAIQHGSMIFNTIYTYGQTGMPTWYVMSSCPRTGTSCTGEIYQVTGGTSPTQPWNGAGKVVSSVGSGTLTFSDANTGTFAYTINKVAGSKSITRQAFAAGAVQPSVDYTDLWWNPNESGWGVALTQQYDMIFAALYSYDSSGNAIWYVASSCPVVGSGCTGDLYQVTGGSSLTSVWNGANKVTAKVGTIAFAFTDANNGTMNYSINGVTGSRNITRQGF